MKLTIQLFATFRTGRFKEAQKDFKENITLGQVVAELGIAKVKSAWRSSTGDMLPWDKG
jgi:hypothetical protein